ncbi:MmgE/PrpD family protein [Paenarthrobacter sp. NPDC090520]|uniref:MmgE/PrpD family protein n=1 Tax=Paenarthrobacter sp. NPDC090520 TaxID=3364382 RepID=UPI00380A3469
MTAHHTASERIARFITELQPEKIPSSVQHRAKIHLLDTLGAGIAGAASKEAAISTTALSGVCGQTLPGTGSTLWGRPGELPALGAAFVNGIACHAFELDDSGGCDHSGAVVVPAAFAALSLSSRNEEDMTVSGGQLLKAIVSGYEVARRVQDALGGYDAVNNAGWHSTGVCGTFGAAVAAGVILGLSEQQMVSAIGLAGSFTGGTWSFIGDGAMSKRMHVGRAAEAGLNSALLARNGFSGPRDLFSAPWGSFLRLYGDPGVTDETKLHDTLGLEWQIERASIKPYATCRSTHAAIDAVLEARAGGISAEDITSITVHTSALIADMCGNADTGSLVSTQLSMQFALAAAILHGEVGLEQIAEAGRTDRRILDLMDRIQLAVDPLQTGGSAEPRLEIQVADVTTEIQAVRAKGAPTNRLSDDETISKFVRLARTRLSGESVDELIRIVMDLEASKDVAQLPGLLKAENHPVLLS